MPQPVEQELLDGARAWPEAQAALLSVADNTRPRYFMDIGWYDVVVDENEGAFCMIRSGSALEELVGDTVVVEYNLKTILVYCVGGSSDLPTDFALQRVAFFNLEMLSTETIPATIQAAL